jgi:sodium-dependent dicarboxylate transporter 2/3/5
MLMGTPAATVATATKTPDTNRLRRKQISIGVGILILVAACLVPPMWGLKVTAIRTLGVIVTTVFWWVTEAIPAPVSGLLVPVLLHITHAVPFNKIAAQSFGDPFVPFMIGCLALSVPFTQSGLGKRTTYMILGVAGNKVSRVLAIFFWISFCHFITDAAVVAVMFPVALSVCKAAGAEPRKSNFGICMMFAITFGAVIGGMATPSGVPANVIAVSFMEKGPGLTVSFLHWMMYCTPIAVASGVFCLWLIKKMFPPEMEYLPFGSEVIKKELAEMGPWSRQEKVVLVVFLITAALWMTGEYTKVPIAVISLLMIGLLTLPGFDACKKGWKEIERGLEWGSIMLMIGGFAMGVAALESGLASWLAQHALQPLAKLPMIMQPFLITLLVAIDSLGFASFTAAASVNVPLVMAYAQANHMPIASMTMAAALASSAHFIVVTESICFVISYAAGYYTFKDLFKIGTITTIACALFIALGLTLFGMPAGVPIR